MNSLQQAFEDSKQLDPRARGKAFEKVLGLMLDLEKIRYVIAYRPSGEEIDGALSHHFNPIAHFHNLGRGKMLPSEEISIGYCSPCLLFSALRDSCADLAPLRIGTPGTMPMNVFDLDVSNKPRR